MNGYRRINNVFLTWGFNNRYARNDTRRFCYNHWLLDIQNNPEIQKEMKSEKQVNDKLTKLCKNKFDNEDKIKMLEWVLENKR